MGPELAKAVSIYVFVKVQQLNYTIAHVSLSTPSAKCGSERERRAPVVNQEPRSTRRDPAIGGQLVATRRLDHAQSDVYDVVRYMLSRIRASRIIKKRGLLSQSAWRLTWGDRMASGGRVRPSPLYIFGIHTALETQLHAQSQAYKNCAEFVSCTFAQGFTTCG